MAEDVIRNPGNGVDIVVEAAWIGHDTIPELRQGIVERRADECACVVHDSEEVAGCDVPYGGMDAGSCSRPWHVQFVQYTWGRFVGRTSGRACRTHGLPET